MYTPLELEQIDFERSVFGGYKIDDVDQIFTVLCRDYETAYRENIELKEKVKTLQEVVAKYDAMEATLQSTLLMAQRTMEETKVKAEEDAKIIVQKAETEAGTLAKKTAEETAQIQFRKQELKKDFDVFVAKCAALLSAQMELLGEYKEKNTVGAGSAHPQVNDIAADMSKQASVPISSQVNETIKAEEQASEGIAGQARNDGARGGGDGARA